MTKEDKVKSPKSKKTSKKVKEGKDDSSKATKGEVEPEAVSYEVRMKAVTVISKPMADEKKVRMLIIPSALLSVRNEESNGLVCLFRSKYSYCCYTEKLIIWIENTIWSQLYPAAVVLVFTVETTMPFWLDGLEPGSNACCPSMPP